MKWPFTNHKQRFFEFRCSSMPSLVKKMFWMNRAHSRPVTLQGEKGTVTLAGSKGAVILTGN